MSSSQDLWRLRRIASLLFLFTAASMSGCGGDTGPKRAVVSGDVTYQGQPVADGEIRFTPIKDTVGPVTLTRIADGRYETAAKGGVPVGTHKVQVFAFLADPKARPEDKGTPAERPRKQFLPAKYNTQSQLELVVEADRNSASKDFDLAK